MQKLIVVHPSLDIKNNNLFLGYSNKVLDIKDRKYKNTDYHLIATTDADGSEKRVSIIKDNQFNHKDITYTFEPNSDNKERRLANLDDRWSRELMEKSTENYKHINNTEVYSRLINTLKQHVKCESEIEYDLLATWIVMTYFYPIFPAIPYLHIKAIKGSGKSTTLDFIKLTAFNASKEAATFASMRDRIDGQKGVYIVDQADNILGTQSNNQMVDIFTDSYKKNGGKVSKMTEEKRKQVIAEFDTYSPKAFASIKELNRDLRDRCIPINLIRSIENLKYLDSDSPVWLEIRDSIYNLLISTFDNVGNEYNRLSQIYLTSNEIVGRKLELWLPIETTMNILNLSGDCIKDAKEYFLNKSKDTEVALSQSEWLVIDRILELIKQNGQEHLWVYTNDIAKGIEFDNLDEDENTKLNKNIYVGNIIRRLGLSSDKGHNKTGNMWKFYSDRVERIKKAYSPVNSSHMLTTNLDTITEVSF